MTTIKTNCNNCREILLTTKDFVGITEDPETGEGSYTFLCPECDIHQTRPANQRVVAVLTAVGIPVTIKLTEDEINSFVLELNDIDDVVGTLQNEEV